VRPEVICNTGWCDAGVSKSAASSGCVACAVSCKPPGQEIELRFDRLKRRELIAVLGSLPLAVRQQPGRLPTIGIFGTAPHTDRLAIGRDPRDWSRALRVPAAT
jgi:hypothetical protein